MLIKVLGSAAGGGFPQANCNCRNCAAVRRGEAGLRQRTQSSVAVSRDGGEWVLLNASPDIRQQIAATPELSPKLDGGVRSSPIKAVVLTNGDVDHVAGLLSLREGLQFRLHATQHVLDTLAANSIFDVLAPTAVSRTAMAPGAPLVLPGGLMAEPFPVSGKAALYLEGAAAGGASIEGDTVGLKITDPAADATFYYIPACARWDPALAARLQGAPLVLFDGTLYSDDEMIRQALSAKTGGRMGHMSISGPQGSLEAFRTLNVRRRIYVHLNNSNPVLNEQSIERGEVERAGWEVAWDGMEIRL
jgi:pyrroloquinoline quinone biosynthesis protein B